MVRSKSRKSTRETFVVVETTEPISPSSASVRIASERDGRFTGMYPGFDTVDASNQLIELVARPSSEYSGNSLRRWVSDQSEVPGTTS